MLPPRRVPLAAAQYDEAVSLLAELLLDAAERARVVSGGANGGVCPGVSGRVIPFQVKGEKARGVA